MMSLVINIAEVMLIIMEKDILKNTSANSVYSSLTFILNDASDPVFSKFISNSHQ